MSSLIAPRMQPLVVAKPATRASSAHRTTVVCRSAENAPMQVVVTGAGGRTGALVMKKLLERPGQFAARGVVRNNKSAQQLKGWGAAEEQVVMGDILWNGEAVLKRAMEGADALVIATSAVPKIKPLSLIPVLLSKIIKKEGVRPQFTFKDDMMPEQIDWLGQKAQIDAAKAAGVKKVVLISSMGGTNRSNFLNTIGDGNILVWKRKAEKYLVDSGLTYTIVHPGGLIDEEGGKRELLIDVDDKLISSGGKYRGIPRADVAEFVVQCLALPEADNRSLDLVAKEPGDAPPTTDFKVLLSDITQNCSYADMEASAAVLAA